MRVILLTLMFLIPIPSAAPDHPRYRIDSFLMEATDGKVLLMVKEHNVKEGTFVVQPMYPVKMRLKAMGDDGLLFNQLHQTVLCKVGYDVVDGQKRAYLGCEKP